MTLPEPVWMMLSGLWTTVRLTLGGAGLAVVLSFASGLSSLSRDPVLRWTSRLYVEVFRGTSALVQLFWFYYALPLLLGVDLSAMTAGVLVLGLNVGAYGSEVVRGALQDVPEGQWEAAASVGLSRVQALRHVVLPQALPEILPPAGNLMIELVKVSALVSLITVGDLTFAADRIRAQTLETGLVYGITLGLYFLLAMVVAFAFRRLERAVARAQGRRAS